MRVCVCVCAHVCAFVCACARACKRLGIFSRASAACKCISMHSQDQHRLDHSLPGTNENHVSWLVSRPQQHARVCVRAGMARKPARICASVCMSACALAWHACVCACAVLHMLACAPAWHVRRHAPAFVRVLHIALHPAAGSAALLALLRPFPHYYPAWRTLLKDSFPWLSFRKEKPWLPSKLYSCLLSATCMPGRA